MFLLGWFAEAGRVLKGECFTGACSQEENRPVRDSEGEYGVQTCEHDHFLSSLPWFCGWWIA